VQPKPATLLRTAEHTADLALERLYEIVHFRSGIPFSLQDRFTLAGITRCGKTTTAVQLAIKYLTSYPGLRVHIFDPKDTGDYNILSRFAPVVHIRDGPAPDPLRQPGVQIWHPKGVSWEEYERYFERLANDPEPHLTILDEIKRLQKRPGDGYSFPPSLSLLYREGAGQWHAVITLVQEVAGAAREIVSQATHVLRFRLENPYDEIRVDRRFARAKRAGQIRGVEPRAWHGFWHARIDALDSAREYTSWRQFI
jgi:hypothetical protein